MKALGYVLVVVCGVCCLGEAEANVSAQKNYLQIQRSFALWQKSQTPVHVSKIPARGLKKRPLPPKVKQLIAQMKGIVRSSPRFSQLPKVVYQLGCLYYHYNHFQKARSILVFLTKKYPQHKDASDAAHLILDMHNIQRQYKALYKAVVGFLTNKRLGDKKTRLTWAKIMQQSHFKVCSMNRRAKRLGEAAECFEKLGEGRKGEGRLAQTAYYNGALLYHRLKKYTKCVMLLKRISSTSRLYKKAQEIVRAGCK